jgi:glycerol kinase
MDETPSSLVIDNGGHGFRVLLIDAHARTVAEAFRPVETRADGERVEQDGTALYQAMIDAIEEVSDAVQGPQAPDIAAAALSVQRGNVMCWSAASGQPLSPVLSWRDRRTQGYSPQQLDAEAIQDRTGLRVSPYAGAAKLAWCLEHIPDVRRAKDAGDLRCGPLGAWLIERLTGTAGVDDTLAQRTLLWSRRDHDWDRDLCACFGVPPSVLPPVYASSHEWRSFKIADRQIPLKLVCGDQNALAWLDGQPNPDSLAINLGTGGFMLRPLPEPALARTFQLSVLDRLDGGRYALEASIHGVGSALDWLLQRHGLSQNELDLDSLARAIDAPPLFINSLDGLGSPWWQPGPASRFAEWPDSSRDDFAGELRALLESIAFLIRVNADCLHRHSGKPRTIRLSGGLSESRLLCELVATLLGQSVQRLKGGEGTALGLWARLNGRSLPDRCLEQIEGQSFPGLTERYRRWLALMPKLQNA